MTSSTQRLHVLPRAPANGKSDPIDAEYAARVVLAGKATATPKLGEGAVETIRVVKIARDSAVRSQTRP